ncbi:hypothetical protein ACHAXA_007242 [Cyclostephanos tholiformis]|uniref:Uncharacterized protein n=1 Tax=Cyclostephanos tholiformis TaxID=382380 RepID=A0ABD3R800_9STRA
MIQAWFRSLIRRKELPTMKKAFGYQLLEEASDAIARDERLNYARREVTVICADNQELEMLNGRLERECTELKRENELAEDRGTFDDITSLQQQNQKLLCDHNSMTEKIAELEDKIRNNTDAIELASLHSEVDSLCEKREKQATLVAGTVHQRDHYRALVAKNDAPFIAHDGRGQDQLALADARAEQLPLIEARNHDLVEEVAKLKAEVSCCKHEQVALKGRLARVDSHANELTNEGLRGDLTTAKATVARLEIDVSHYQGRTVRLENSLAMVKSECESESRRKTQAEELLSKTQAHLEAVRGKLTKKEQQYQQVNLIPIRRERDGLRRLLVRRDAEAEERAAERERLLAELEGARAALRRREGEAAAAGMAVVAERGSHEGTRAELARALERADRIDREADGLRAEISRLARSNEESNALLSAMANQHSQSSGELMPLKLQVQRLEQELDAVTSHSNYLDGQLLNRNDVITSLRHEHSTEVRALRSELVDVRLTLERTEMDLTSARLVNDRTSHDIERLQEKARDAELEHATQRELLERDLDKERELAALKDQRALLAEDRSVALSREVEELKELAREATNGATAQAEEMRARWSEVIDEAVRAAREEEGRKLADVEERLRLATEASEIIMDGGSSPRRRARTIMGDGAGADDSMSPMRLLDSVGGGDSPLGLTDLYARLAEAEDENQKLKIIIDRIQRDELDDANERLNYARREVTDIRADKQELEMQNGRLERECTELKRENVELATQVQSLLQRRCAESAEDRVLSFDDMITSLQQQNQKLLRDHNSMTEKIAELEDKIRNNLDAIELASLRSEVDSLCEEREKQATLVAGTVHQRDHYRALVAKNDAPFIAQDGRGQDQLALADARAEQLPLIKARNHDLVEEVAKLKAEVSCCKHEQVALKGRLARVDSHANELTTSNERLRGDLTTAKATVARLEIDVSHYQGRTERLENSLAMVKSECESESRRKTQAEELLSKTQAHLEAVRGKLAKISIFSHGALWMRFLSQASSEKRLLEVQLETSVADEKRLVSEAGALSAEIARQKTLLSSIQGIEASLMAKAEGELENLRKELKRIQETKSDDATKHDAAVQKLEGKIADLEITVKNLTAQKEAATVSAAKATADCSNLNLKLKEPMPELKAAQKELNATKIKLGDVTIDTSAEEALEAKVASLTAELESTKFELATAQTRIVDYQAIVKSSEEQLADLTAASTKYKDETTAMLAKLRQSEKVQCETVAELTKDLMSHRNEKEKAVNELKATIDSLTSQLLGSREDAAKAMSRTESLTEEARRYQLNAKNANVNYEGELALHAAAPEALRDARAGMESEQRLRETVESQLASAQAIKIIMDSNNDNKDNDDPPEEIVVAPADDADENKDQAAVAMLSLVRGGDHGASSARDDDDDGGGEGEEDDDADDDGDDGGDSENGEDDDDRTVPLAEVIEIDDDDDDNGKGYGDGDGDGDIERLQEKARDAELEYATMRRQWQLEHESALEELDDANERLNYARREVTDIRADKQELEMLNGRLGCECTELKRENVELATQVQSLLQRRCAESAEDRVLSFDDMITSLQQQNQKLLRDHNSMTEKIAELEDKIRNNLDAIELASLRSEVDSLCEEREKRATLVAGTVHQRDHYRALVAKNDAPSIAHDGRGQDQLALADAQAEQLPLIEARNHDLVEEVAKLKAEVSCCKHEQVALKGRLEIDVSHYQGRTERLENSLAMVKSECESESRRKTQAEELLSKTQAHLEAVRGKLAKNEQQYQQVNLIRYGASSEKRLLEVQLETSVADEKRLVSEAGALSAEIARQKTLLSSIQGIEASLMVKAEGELKNLRKELKRIQETKSDDATKHDAAVQKLEGKIADLEITVKNLTAQKEAATVSAAKATADCSNLNLKLKEPMPELKAAQKELNATKIKLGDVTIDTSAEEALEAKVASLTAELESTKFELATAQTRIVDYQAIVKSSEEQLADLTAASTKYKDETTAMLAKLRQSEKVQCETVAELTKDLMSHRNEKEKAVNELKATIDSLTSQLLGSREDAAKAMSRTESLTEEARRYQLNAKNANVNYEGELALHAAAPEALRDARAGMESEHHEGTRAELARALERADRIDREADGLRAEISRLARSNEESNALLSAMANQHSQSSGELMPLKLQVQRLEQELDAVTSHSNYLDGQLLNRNDVITSLRHEHSTEVRALRSELVDVRLTLERTEMDLTSARLVNDRTSHDIERLQEKARDAELEHATQRELLERDLDKERELAALKDQRALLAEDRSVALSREVEELKELAREATNGATAQAEEMRARWSEVIDEAVRAAREEEGRKLADVEERLRLATEASEIIMDGGSSPRRRARTIMGDGAGADDSMSPMRLLDSVGGGDSPLGLTDLYARLAEAEDENQKLKIIIDRIQRDVAAKTPMIRRWQLEHESALEELDDANERLNYARREVTDIRADKQELEMQNGRLERECTELKRENVELATQVQSLLQRRCAESAEDRVLSFDDMITSLQQQNQKLLRDHNSMTEKIAELEDKIRNNLDAIELASLRSEVDSLCEEREKQATLVAGTVHQRDHYRALVAKNDAPFIAQDGRGQDQLALADARAEQLPLIKARNHDLVEEVAKLKAEVSCCKHEQVALKGRLARVDSHANELTTSNERLRGDLTTAKATVARLEIDVSHYQGRTERLENSLAMVKSECESESRRKTQAEELLSKTQAHLEAVRGKLAKNEQQYQQVNLIRYGASSEKRLLEVQLETSVADEKRLVSEAGALSAEIARQKTLLSSIQGIEASLMVKAEGELENLRKELKRIQETKSDDATKHDAAVQKLEGKIADLEITVKNLTAQKEAATVSAAKATADCSNLNLKLKELQADIAAEKASWVLSKAKLEEFLQEAKLRLDDMRIQNKMLHDQMASLSATVEKFQSTKASALMGNESAGDGAEENSDAAGAVVEKQPSDLRELLRFKQSECAMLEADLASAKRASERERTAAELANRSLEEARSELMVLREVGKDDVGGASASEKEMGDLRAKLNGAEEQLVLLRESNIMLREQKKRLIVYLVIIFVLCGGGFYLYGGGNVDHFNSNCPGNVFPLASTKNISNASESPSSKFKRDLEEKEGTNGEGSGCELRMALALEGEVRRLEAEGGEAEAQRAAEREALERERGEVETELARAREAHAAEVKRVLDEAASSKGARDRDSERCDAVEAELASARTQVEEANRHDENLEAERLIVYLVIIFVLCGGGFYLYRGGNVDHFNSNCPGNVFPLASTKNVSNASESPSSKFKRDLEEKEGTNGEGSGCELRMALALEGEVPSQGGEGDNWIVAEEDSGDETEQDGRRKRVHRKDSIQALGSHLGDMAPGGNIMDEVEEEGWGAFGPDADMKDDGEEEDVHMFQPEEDSDTEGVENRGRESIVSRTELVRDAASVTSDRQLSMNETPLKFDSMERPRPSSASAEPDFGGNGGGDLDFDADISSQPLPVADLSVDTTNDDESSRDRRRSNLGDLEISGLDDEASKAGSEKKKRKGTASGTRMKKRRKIVIDNNQTELTSKQMKAMLRDTSDIVLQNVLHLASWPREDAEEEDNYLGLCPAIQRLPTEHLLARPCIGDDGGLAPELLALWGRNMCKITGKAGTQLPFRMLGKQGEKQRGAIAEKLMEEAAAAEEEMEDEEKLRSQQVRDSMDGHFFLDDVEFGGGDHNVDFGEEEKHDDADLETPFDIQDEFGSAEYKNDNIAEDDELSVHSDRSSFSLGALNDLEKDFYEIGEEEEDGGHQPGQVAGDARWHKHTIRVLSMLKRSMQSDHANEDELDDEESGIEGGGTRKSPPELIAGGQTRNPSGPREEEAAGAQGRRGIEGGGTRKSPPELIAGGMGKPAQLSYNKLSTGCSRRTAASAFFDILQLKNLDFVELNQEKSYGDITITPGLRFDEPPPSTSVIDDNQNEGDIEFENQTAYDSNEREDVVLINVGYKRRKVVMPNDQRWYAHFDELKKYKCVHHTCCVQENHNKKLFNWVKAQRAAFKRGGLDQKRCYHLQSIGFTWELRKREMTTK